VVTFQAARSSSGPSRTTSAVSGTVPPPKSLPGMGWPGMAGFTGRASAPPMKSLPTGVESSRMVLPVNVGVSMF
jgi:hypothetical protein